MERCKRSITADDYATRPACIHCAQPCFSDRIGRLICNCHHGNPFRYGPDLPGQQQQPGRCRSFKLGADSGRQNDRRSLGEYHASNHANAGDDFSLRRRRNTLSHSDVESAGCSNNDVTGRNCGRPQRRASDIEPGRPERCNRQHRQHTACARNCGDAQRGQRTRCYLGRRLLQRRRQNQELHADVEHQFVSNSERAVRPHEKRKRSCPRRPRGHFLFGESSIRDVFSWPQQSVGLSRD